MSKAPIVTAMFHRPKRSKYGATKVRFGEHVFDSRHERDRWLQLRALEMAGKIAELERQVVFVLAPSVRIKGEKRARPALRFKLDFRYLDLETNLRVHDDAKGFADTAFRIRQHLMKSVHGIDVVLS